MTTTEQQPQPTRVLYVVDDEQVQRMEALLDLEGIDARNLWDRLMQVKASVANLRNVMESNRMRDLAWALDHYDVERTQLRCMIDKAGIPELEEDGTTAGRMLSLPERLAMLFAQQTLDEAQSIEEALHDDDNAGEVDPGVSRPEDRLAAHRNYVRATWLAVLIPVFLCVVSGIAAYLEVRSR